MRLDDLMNKRGDQADIPAEVERELEILDAALRGEEIPAGMEGIEALVSDLRVEKPEPEPRFQAELDDWAAAGFPRGKRPGVRTAGGGSGANGGLFGRFSSGGSRGWAPVAATVAAVVVVGVSLTQIGDFGGDEALTGGDVAQDAGGEAADVAEPTAPSAEEAANDLQRDLGRVTDDAGAGGDVAGSPAYNSQEFSLDSDQRLVEPGVGSLSSKDASANRGQEKRRVERDAQLTLAAPADEVADVNDQVIDVVEGANGVVLNSRVTGTDDFARATLEVKVPSSTLDDTLASLSELANVKSRTEQSQDITRVYVSAKDRLVGLRAERDNLATRIREADTDAEVQALQAQLAAVNRQIADAKSDLNQVTTRAQLATVTITISSEGAGTSENDDGWSFGDALNDAGKVLEVGAGVALISAAVLLPLSIIAAIAYFVISAANRRSREKALGE
jgi:hypothetical protein